jgi:Uma2 family endonuclease
MAEPVWKTPTGTPWEPEHDAPEEGEERSTLQRWIELPDGSIELLELPLTPELFLDPELDDKMVQGQWHEETSMEIAVVLREFYRDQPDVRVFHDLKHLFGRGLSAPAPDVSVVRGIRDPAPLDSLDVVKEGVRPSLVIEVVSPMSARVRQTDMIRKVKLYERVRIPEYLIVDSARKRVEGRQRFTLLGYRLDSSGRYRPIAPDEEGRFLSEQTGILFQVGPTGDRVLLFVAATGQRLLTPLEQAERADLAVERAAREAERAAHEAERATQEAERADRAEAEAARLRAEIERLRGDR